MAFEAPRLVPSVHRTENTIILFECGIAALMSNTEMAQCYFGDEWVHYEHDVVTLTLSKCR